MDKTNLKLKKNKLKPHIAFKKPNNKAKTIYLLEPTPVQVTVLLKSSSNN